MTDRLLRSIDDLRRKWVPDRRLGVFDVTLADEGRGLRLTGVTTSRDALAAVRRLASEAGLLDDLQPLPDPALAPETDAIVTAAVAPLLSVPGIKGERVTEALHGETLVVLQKMNGWLRVRAADGYHAWTHAGYVATGPADWADDWTARATVRSLGAELKCSDLKLRLPIGARVAPRRDGALEAADGRVCQLAGGVLRDASELGVEARLVAAPEWALRWFSGAPYLWGGRTEWGVDCSGLVQAVYAARGVALRRDTDLQSVEGREVPLAERGRGWEAGVLLYFAEEGRVSHTAIWAGAGRIVHAALSRGGVASDDLFGDSLYARRLRGQLVAVRRPPNRLSFPP
ncbi:MAG: C40 family peptidase [Gemmatimonadetes bacterium]|nr:C40 family peptidase [Gemmatimonadota bacterium]